jgi:hypothetical protein
MIIFQMSIQTRLSLWVWAHFLRHFQTLWVWPQKTGLSAPIPQPPAKPGASGISALSLARETQPKAVVCTKAAPHRAQECPQVEQMRPGFSQGSARRGKRSRRLVVNGPARFGE